MILQSGMTASATNWIGIYHDFPAFFPALDVATFESLGAGIIVLAAAQAPGCPAARVNAACRDNSDIAAYDHTAATWTTSIVRDANGENARLRRLDFSEMSGGL
jgi:hypothetical protein